MFLYPRSKDRPFYYGPFPLESLPRDVSQLAAEAARPAERPNGTAQSNSLLKNAAEKCREIFAGFVEGEAAGDQAPVPDDLRRRAEDIKGGAYFMDMSQVGICKIPENAWLDGVERSAHDHAVVLLQEHPRLPEADNLARGWLNGSVEALMNLRVAEVTACVAVISAIWASRPGPILPATGFWMRRNWRCSPAWRSGTVMASSIPLSAATSPWR